MNLCADFDFDLNWDWDWDWDMVVVMQWDVNAERVGN